MDEQTETLNPSGDTATSKETAISENDFLKPKRGRPPHICDDKQYGNFIRKFMSETSRPNLGKRSLQNWHYLLECMSALKNDDEFGANDIRDRWPWLMWDGNMRRTIMFQLGRTPCKRTIRVFADRICELKPRTQDAVKLIREWQRRREFLIAEMICDGKETFSDSDLEHVARLAAKYERL